MDQQNALKFFTFLQDKVSFNEVLVHIDFKGAPPKFDFLMNFMQFIASGSRSSQQVATGFLLEFEDMLPFEGQLMCCRKCKYPPYT